MPSAGLHRSGGPVSEAWWMTLIDLIDGIIIHEDSNGIMGLFPVHDYKFKKMGIIIHDEYHDVAKSGMITIHELGNVPDEIMSGNPTIAEPGRTCLGLTDVSPPLAEGTPIPSTLDHPPINRQRCVMQSPNGCV